MNTQSVTQTLARLGASHGYRFDGDVVFLNASFLADASADAGRSWRLRLVAGDIRSGHVIAEAPLPPLSELTGAVENFEAAVPAQPPAARGFHELSLVLLSRDAAGTETVHDHATYTARQAFAQPRLCGPLGLWFESDTELVLDLDRVSNPRADNNLSGTLSVEVWALENAYAGGAFAGQPVAGAILGSLAGGQAWTPGALHLHAAKPAASSHLVVMLREWNGSAYVTRDFVNFAPAPVAAPAVAAPPTTAASTSVAAAPTAAPASTPAPVVAPAAPTKPLASAKPGTAAKTPPGKPAAKSAKSSKKSSR